MFCHGALFMRLLANSMFDIARS